MKPTTTILLAALIGASTAHAYHVTAPPEIRANFRTINAIVDEAVLFGSGCYYGFLLQTDNIDDCRKWDEAVAAFQKESDIFQKWMHAEMEKGATKTDVDVTPAIGRLLDMHEKIQRAIKYGAE